MPFAGFFYTMIRIDTEFQNLIPPLTEEEFSGLKENILSEGVRDPLVCWRNGDLTLLDGHNRHRICTENNIHFNIIERDFEDREDAKTWIIQNQFCRRNLSKYQRCVLALDLKKVLEKKAKEKEQIRKKINQIKPIDINDKDLTAEQRAIVEILEKYKGSKGAYAVPDRIYFVKFENRIKIGCSSNPEDRIKEIKRHVPGAALLGICPGGITLEKSIHKALSEHKIITNGLN